MTKKKIKRPNAAKVVYRIYKNENGLLLESKSRYDEPNFSDFNSIEDAIDVMERSKPMYAEFVILPILFVDEKERQR